MLGGGERMVDNSLLQLVRTGSCVPICSSSTQDSCAAEMRAFVDQGSTSSVLPGDRAPALDVKSRTVFSVVAAMLVALLLLLLLTGIRMCALSPSPLPFLQWMYTVLNSTAGV